MTSIDLSTPMDKDKGKAREKQINLCKGLTAVNCLTFGASWTPFQVDSLFYARA